MARVSYNLHFNDAVINLSMQFIYTQTSKQMRYEIKFYKIRNKKATMLWYEDMI